MFEGRQIDIAEALQLRDTSETRPFFACTHCGEAVRAHRDGGEHSEAHFEHHERNFECPFSAGQKADSGTFAFDDPRALEGHKIDLNLLVGARNQALVTECKARDDYSCRACGFKLKVSGRFVIECHHLNPIGSGGVRETSLADLVCLCPVCHRIAHTRKEPLSIEEVREVMARAVRTGGRIAGG